MRKFLLLLLPIIPFTVFAKGTLSGKWVEVKRTKLDKTSVSYKDTIRISFMIGNEYIWQKEGSYGYRGKYTLNDKDLDIGLSDFTVLQRTGDKLLLQDDVNIHEFAPDHSVPQQNASVKPETPPGPVTSIDQMIGHWSVYKRTSDKALGEVDYTRILKMIDITGGSSDGKLGYLYASKDADNAPSWTIDKFENQTLYCSGKDNRTFKVLKCENNDMVLEEDGITYFFKQFK